ncbi:uncharacterized protein BYT42DRAFT_616977 [Radiomyces spectabilis]|uniref:uncharacterized protein n=1 Tax=Radiomyces spectabilis TaxID=64574 RepID=UPI00221FC068|nr:uncharacterized protein BYT42DRAFT_616977 [Radiomyces spectabilis]KAI8370426.1 hypothetical protein BYT42DRAFT_616977 [Radiomyces spectabilis]
MASLTIHLDNHQIILTEQSTCMISGSLRIHADHLHGRPCHAKLQLLGQERVRNDIHSLLDTTYTVARNSTDFIQEPNGVFILPFSFHIASDLPVSFQSTIYDTLAYIDYTLTATVRLARQETLRAIQNLELYNSFYPAPPFRLYWGTSKQWPKWRYEVEVPHTIAYPQRAMLNVRVLSPSSMKRSSPFRNNHHLETCLIGCQLFESIRIGQEKEYEQRPLMTFTHMLTWPSHSWSFPCQLPLEFEEPPKPNLSTRLMEVVHRLRVTIIFSNPLGVTDQVQMEFPIIVLSVASTTRSRSNTANSDHDSALSLTNSCYSDSISDKEPSHAT